MVLTGCGLKYAKNNVSNRVCPQPIIITEQEQIVIRSNLPKFYLRFTNQQLDLMEVK